MSEQRLIAIEQVLRDLAAQGAAVLAKVDAVDEKVSERVKEGREFRATVQEAVFDEHHGLAVRVDRIEQAGKRTKWLFRLVVGTFASLAAASFWGWASK